MAMKFIDSLKKRKLLIQESRLYAQPDQINVKLFFKILEMGMYPDLNLLKRKKRSRVSQELLSLTWNNLREYYFSSINKASFDKFKREYKETITLQNSITGIQAAIILVSFGEEEGYETLEHFGIKSKTEAGIKSGLYKKQTSLKLLYSRLNSKSKKESAKFYSILADIEAKLPHQINVENTSLERWVEIVISIKNRNLAEKEMQSRGKNNKKK